MTLIQTAFLGYPKATRDHSSDNGASQQLISLSAAGPAPLPGEAELGSNGVPTQAALRCLDGPTTSTGWIVPPLPVPPLGHFLLPFPTLFCEFWI